MTDDQRAELYRLLTLFGIADDDVTVLADTDAGAELVIGARKGRPKRLSLTPDGRTRTFANTTGRA